MKKHASEENVSVITRVQSLRSKIRMLKFISGLYEHKKNNSNNREKLHESKEQQQYILVTAYVLKQEQQLRLN
jgi:hypothetical protein